MEHYDNLIQNQYGSCAYCICDNCSMIYDLYVQKKHRRKGHAKELIQTAIDAVRLTGYDKEISVEARPTEDSIDIEKLILFYKEMGLNVIE
jgi:GNAT superfamily N-acetyltransferase